MVAGLVGAADPVGHGGHFAVGNDGDGLDGLDGAQIAGRGAEMVDDFGLGGEAVALVQSGQLAGLDFVHVVVAAQQQQPDLAADDLPFVIGFVGGQHQRFDGGLQWHAQKCGHVGTGAFSGGGRHLHGLAGCGARVRGRQRFGLFHVGGVVALRAVDDGVFAGGGNHLEFFTQIAANGAAVGRHGTVAQAKAVENAAVSLRHAGVAGLGAFGILVEAVGIFHDELAAAHQAKARAALVAELGLDLVQVLGQLLVAAQVLPGDVGDHFLAGGLDHEIVVVPVLDAQQFGAHFFEAARFLPEFGGLHHGHGAFDGACAVHLLAHDLFNLADDAQAQRHEGVDAGAQALDEARAHHELVADDFGIGGGVAQGGEMESGSFHEAGAMAQKTGRLGDSAIVYRAGGKTRNRQKQDNPLLSLISSCNCA